YAVLILTLLLTNHFIPQQYTKYFGILSLFMLLVALTPGTLRRFHVNGKFANLLMIYRRNFGIFTYLFVVTHELTYLSGSLNLGPDLFLKAPTFVKFGMVASFLLLPLFLTSNDYAVRVLKQWWKRLHKLVYLVIVLVYLHLLFQKRLLAIVPLIWMLMNLLAVAYNDFFRKKD
ncbi:ferric reductase-like transmembrane domain-containing protein, partial [Candidatus Dojkabacteria bacterium]|nr:ferric reductase-like transmembrane domain-containing protein [Candidatus Dojkabacteria bacterium]